MKNKNHYLRMSDEELVKKAQNDEQTKRNIIQFSFFAEKAYI